MGVKYKFPFIHVLFEVVPPLEAFEVVPPLDPFHFSLEPSPVVCGTFNAAVPLQASSQDIDIHIRLVKLYAESGKLFGHLHTHLLTVNHLNSPHLYLSLLICLYCLAPNRSSNEGFAVLSGIEQYRSILPPYGVAAVLCGRSRGVCV